jgi:hypothetical protein
MFEHRDTPLHGFFCLCPAHAKRAILRYKCHPQESGCKHTTLPASLVIEHGIFSTYRAGTRKAYKQVIKEEQGEEHIYWALCYWNRESQWGSRRVGGVRPFSLASFSFPF